MRKSTRSADVPRPSRFLVGELRQDGTWGVKFVGEFWAGAGFSMPLPEGESERLQIEGAVRTLLGDSAVRTVDVEAGFRVSRA